MTNVEKVYDELKAYRRKVAYATEKAAAELEEIEEMRGSPYYDRRAREIEDKRLKDIDGSRSYHAKRLDEVFDAMRENAARVLPDPPTSEMLETLQLLKMQENPGWNEIRNAAAVCANNAQAMAVVREIAAKHNVMVPLKVKNTIGDQEIADAIGALLSYARVTLRLTKVNNGADWYNQGMSHLTGVKDTTGGQGIDFFRVDKDVSSPQEMCHEFGGIRNNEAYEKFCKAVND